MFLSDLSMSMWHCPKYIRKDLRGSQVLEDGNQQWWWWVCERCLDDFTATPISAILLSEICSNQLIRHKT